jgi:hypothetical protein
MANEFKIKRGLIVNGSGSTILDIQGSQGQLFSVTDQLSGSLFSVNDISGIPILEVFSDDSVNIGVFGAEAIKVSGSTANITGSLFGTSSFAVSSSRATSSSFASTASFSPLYLPLAGGTVNGNVIITGSVNVSGSVAANLYSINTLNTAPATATSTGTLGEVRYTADFIYVCIATNTWRRTALTTWV